MPGMTEDATKKNDVTVMLKDVTNGRKCAVDGRSK